MDLIERIFFAELGVAVLAALLALRESFYLYRLGRSELNSPPSWILRMIAYLTWAITAAAVYFAVVATLRILQTSGHPALRPLAIASGAIVIGVLSIPAYIGFEFRRRRE